MRRLRADLGDRAHARDLHTAAYPFEARTLAEACGVVHLLTKPTEPQLIIATVQALLGRPRRRRRRRRRTSSIVATSGCCSTSSPRRSTSLETLNVELEERVVFKRTAELAEANTAA